MFRSIVFLLFASSSLYAEVLSTGDPIASPKGYFLVDPFVNGKVTKEHLKWADESWEEVTAIVGINPNRIYHFDLKLWDRSWYATMEDGSRLKVNGLIEGFTIHVRQDKRWVFRHEMLHLALGMLANNRDQNHTARLWKGACKCASKK